MACLCVHTRFLGSEREKERKSWKVRGCLLIFFFWFVWLVLAGDAQTDTS